MSFVLEGVTLHYGETAHRTTALAGVSFAAKGAEFISIVGPSGCGKTTLLKILAGLVEPSAGRLAFGEMEGSKLRSALVFQDHGLLPWYDVLENVALGTRFQSGDHEAAIARARQLITRFGLERFMHHKPHQLSIGMRQRVGIARAFAADSSMLLLDEPFGSLDAQTRLVLQDELLRIWQEHKKLVVHVTHDINEAILLSDRILVMSGRPGRIREDIPISFPRPRNIDVPFSNEGREIHRHIWNILEEEVRESLCLTH
jgi:NitT/TauT family transport system ATP-binding protein